MVTISKKSISTNDLDKALLKSLIKKFSTAKVLVIGDVILDEYLLGSPERISREAPVMILNYKNSKYALGGAGNAANNIASYSANCKLIGIVGNDSSRHQIETLCKEENIDIDLIIDETRFTTVKTRIISTSNSNADNGTMLKQQVLRVDRQDRNDISSDIEKELIEKFKANLDETDIVLVSDYSSGVLTDTLSEAIIRFAKEKGKTVIVDTTGDYNKFKGADVITPNQPDAEKMLGYKLENDSDLEKGGQKLMKDLDAKQVLITRGAKGMALFEKAQDNIDLSMVPAFNLSEVFDVTGAGDTVAGTLAVSLAIGASSLDSAILGNLGASLVVRKYGTATTNQDELLDILKEI